MTKIVIYDAMSTIRERLQSSQSRPGFITRGVINDALRKDQMPIFAWDGKAAKTVRQAIFPGYKNRPPAPQGIYAALNFIRELIAYTPAVQLWHDGFEGDDVIAAFVERFAGKFPIEIQTRDVDLVALTTKPLVTCTAQTTIDPKWLFLYKTCVGDASDTVPGIKGFGQKTWDECDKIQLELYLLRALTGDPLPLWEQGLQNAGMSKASVAWFKDNIQQVRDMRRVLSPLPMTEEQFDAAIHMGNPQPVALEAQLAKFML